MEDLSKYTLTELLKLINDTKTSHDALKKEIIDYTYQVDELEKVINNKINELSVIEKNYVRLIEEMEKR